MSKTKAQRKAAKRTTATPAKRLSPQRKLMLASVAPASLNEATARNAAIAAVKAAGGNDPLVRREYIAGRIGGGLRRLGSNATDAMLIKDGYAVIDMAGKDASRVADGQTRRSPEQERLYGAGRVAWSALLRDAGIVSMTSRDTSKTRKPKAGANKKAANNNRPASPKVKDASAALAHVVLQAAALLSFTNKNAKIMPPALSTAIGDFNTAVKAVKLTA